jgi:outer membrane protein assembly factor BamB
MDYAAPLIGADGAVYLGSTRGYFCCLNPDGTLRWKYELLDDDGISSSPAVGADGTTYFLAGDGYLYALRTKITLADSPWPKFHHDLRNSGRVGGR